MSRIKLTDNVISVVTKMSDGNPGAINVMMVLIKEGERIDPQAFMGGLGVILSLDKLEIYGSSIYILYKDQCGKDLRKLIMLLRAVQLGILSHYVIKNIAKCQTRENLLSDKEMGELDKKVCERLDRFEKPKIREQLNL